MNIRSCHSIALRLIVASTLDGSGCGASEESAPREAPATEVPATEAPAAPAESEPQAATSAAPAPTAATPPDPSETDAEPEPPAPPKRARGLDCMRIEEDGYRRGVTFPITVVMIDGRRVEEHTANAYMAMAAAAKKDGIELGIHSGFRSMAEQIYFYDCYKTCACNGCAKAAKPGHSKHQSGRALDLAMGPGVFEWLKRHGRRFGFKNTVRSEPWHWEYRRRRKHRFAPACPKP